MKKQKGEEGKKGKYSGILAFLSLSAFRYEPEAG